MIILQMNKSVRVRVKDDMLEWVLRGLFRVRDLFLSCGFPEGNDIVLCVVESMGIVFSNWELVPVGLKWANLGKK